MGTWLSRAEPALLLLAPKHFVSLSCRSGDVFPQSAAPSSARKCISNNQQLWGLTEMDVLRRGVGGKAAGKCRCRCRFARGRFVPYESRPGGGGGGRAAFWVGNWTAKKIVQTHGWPRAQQGSVVAIQSYFKKSMNKHTISLKSRWGFLLLILAVYFVTAFFCCRDVIRDVSQLALFTVFFSSLFHLGCCIVPAAH